PTFSTPLRAKSCEQPTVFFVAQSQFCGVSQTARFLTSRPIRKSFGSWLFEWVIHVRKISCTNTHHTGTRLKELFRSIWGRSVTGVTACPHARRAVGLRSRATGFARLETSLC